MSQSVLAVELSAEVAMNAGFFRGDGRCIRCSPWGCKGGLTCLQGVLGHLQGPLPCLCGPKTLPPAVVAATCSE